MGSECGYCCFGGVIAVVGLIAIEAARRWLVRIIDEGREQRGE